MDMQEKAFVIASIDIYVEQEKKARKLDMEYVRSTFLNVKFIEHKGQDHSEYFTLHPKEFCEDLIGIMTERNE